MKIVFHKNFEKQYGKIRFSEKEQFKERRDIFSQDEFNPILHNHALKGKFKGYRSINIAGDLRAVYKSIDGNTVMFVALDTHSNLYG